VIVETNNRHRRARQCAAVLAALALLCACDSKQTTPPASAQPGATSPTGAHDAGAAASGGGTGSASDAGASAPSAKARVPDHLNVILISIDSLRADMPWAGYPRDIAPNLAALEKKSVSFTHAYSLSSYTSMSLGGFLAGRYPSELKRDGFFFGTYAKENVFFPELLQKNGIHTFSAHAHGYFKDAGFQQGFDQWELVPNLKWNNTTDENVTGEAHEHIAERMLGHALEPTGTGADAGGGTDGGGVASAAGRFFAWFHFLDPHDQYMAHEQDGIASFGNKPRDKYDAEVVYTDQKIGKLLAFIDQQPWKDRTAIIVTADHGEAFGEHKQFLHGFEVWENLVRVPLFFYVPGVSRAHLDTPVSALDMAPTILDMFGVEKDPEMEGRSLYASVKGGAEPEALDVVVDLPVTSDNDKRRAVIYGKKKAIAFGEGGAIQAFDLEQDPAEEHPITSGDAFDAASKRYRDASARIKEVSPYACQKGCLNRAYLNAAPASSPSASP
jgi:arylsulfatase A-like enzyme